MNTHYSIESYNLKSSFTFKLQSKDLVDLVTTKITSASKLRTCKKDIGPRIQVQCINITY